jgi:hypothetical protein
MSKQKIFIYLLFQITLLVTSVGQNNSDQFKRDSILLRDDSIAKIPLQFLERTFFEDTFKLYQVNDYILKRDEYSFDISLPNYKSLYVNRNLFENRINSFQHGFTSHEKYFFSTSKYQFISPSKPYTEVEAHESKSYTNSRAGFQDNLDVKAFFASRYKNNTLWNFKYEKTNQKGMYANSGNRIHAFSSGLQLTPSNSSLSADLILVYNNLKNQHNFGILDLTNLNNTSYRVRESIQTYSTSSNSTIKNAEYGMNLKYAPKFLTHTLLKANVSYFSSYSYFNYNYTDDDPSTAKFEYNNYYIDSNSIIASYYQKTWSNRIKLNTSLSKYIKADAALHFNSIMYDYDTLATKLVQKIAEFRAQFSPTTAIFLEGKAWQDIEYNNQYDYSVSLRYILEPYFSLQGELGINSISPTLLQKQFITNKKLLYNNDLSNQKRSYIQAKLKSLHQFLPTVSLSIESIDNLIYFSQLEYYLQSNTRITHQNFTLHHNYTHRYFGLENHFSLDRFSPDIPHWNMFTGTHKAYVNASLFNKAAFAKFGITTTWIDIPYVYNFNPLLNQFASTNIVTTNINPNLGFFMNFKISDFNLHIQFDHIESFWTKNSFIVENQAVYDFYTWFTMNWKFTY